MPDDPAPDSDLLFLDGLRHRLRDVAQTGAPALRGFAAWLADRPEELAFHSVRSLAEAAETDANTVVRAVKAAGFGGYAEARRTAQQALRRGDGGYAGRAGALSAQTPPDLQRDLAQAARQNAERAFGPALTAAVAELVPHLLAARRVHCIGVRMGYALAYYFTYRGGVAHPNIAPTPSQPGVIVDALAETGPGDVVIVISFAHYSAEVVRAARIATARGARLVAITDSPASPLAAGAWRMLRAPLAGPNVMSSLSGALLIIEQLLELMAASDPGALPRIQAFESRLLDLGAYVGTPKAPRRR